MIKKQAFFGMHPLIVLSERVNSGLTLTSDQVLHSVSEVMDSTPQDTSKEVC